MIIRDITVNYECRKSFRCLRKNGLPKKNLFVLFKTPAYVSVDGKFVYIEAGSYCIFEKGAYTEYYSAQDYFCHDFFHFTYEAYEKNVFENLSFGKVCGLRGSGEISDIISLMKKESRLAKPSENRVLSELAAKMYMSTSYFQHLYKELFATTFNADILMHDIANEPYNNVYGTDRAFNKVSEFLEEMIRVLRTVDGRRITVGSQGCYFNGEKKIRDVTRLAPSVDVISLHTYNRHNKPKDVFEAETVELMDYIETFGKPFLITECCWGAPTEDERLPYLESELETFSKLGVGYIVQGLFTSPVADLHPIEESHMTEGLYMAFLDRNLNVRKHHDIFNKF